MTGTRPRLGVVQRVLPAYRAGFFDALAGAFPQGVGVFAGQGLTGEALGGEGRLQAARLFPAHNIHILRGALYLCWQGGLTGWLEEWQPGVLVVEANPRYLSTSTAVRWMHGRGRPVIGWGLGTPAGGVLGGLRRQFIGNFDALLTYSRQGAAQYAAAGFPAGRIFVAPNAAAARPVSVPARTPLAPGQPAVVLFVGRLQERKRVHLLIQACAGLPANLQPHLVIVGDGPARPELESLAARVYPMAEFCGTLTGRDLEAQFERADLFVMPGTGGLALQQALAHALPVMAAEADGTQADLVRPENGWLLPPGDADALQATLAAALADPAALRRMGMASYRLAVEEVNLEIMVEAFTRAVDAVTGG